LPLRRPARELCGQVVQVYAVPPLELSLADAVLLTVMISAQADGPAVRWFLSNVAVSADAYVRTFDRSAQAI